MGWTVQDVLTWLFQKQNSRYDGKDRGIVDSLAQAKMFLHPDGSLRVTPPNNLPLHEMEILGTTKLTCLEGNDYIYEETT